MSFRSMSAVRWMRDSCLSVQCVSLPSSQFWCVDVHVKAVSVADTQSECGASDSLIEIITVLGLKNYFERLFFVLKNFIKYQLYK